MYNVYVHDTLNYFQQRIRWDIPHCHALFLSRPLDPLPEIIQMWDLCAPRPVEPSIVAKARARAR